MPRISVEAFPPGMSCNHPYHGQTSIWQSSSSVLKWSSESKHSHKKMLWAQNSPEKHPQTSPPTPSAILLEAFDRKVPLRKEWPEKLTTDLWFLKSCKSSDLQKIRQEILHSYELQCRGWHLGYSVLTDEFPILLLMEWMLKKKPESYLPVLIPTY